MCICVQAAGTETKSSWNTHSQLGAWVMDTLWTEISLKADLKNLRARYVAAPNLSYARVGDALLIPEKKVFWISMLVTVITQGPITKGRAASWRCPPASRFS